MTDLADLMLADARAWQAGVDRPTESNRVDSLPVFPAQLYNDGRRSRRRRLVPVLIAAVILGVLAIGTYALVHADSNSTGPANAGPATLSASPDPKIPHQPSSSLGFPLVTSLSADEARTLTSAQWRLVAIHDAQRTIQIYFFAGDGSCSTPAGIFVQQTATTVLVEALLKIDHSQQNCPSRALLAGATIRLQSALGTRTLLHAQVKSGYDHILQ
jgi:hypothetical protein